MYEESIEICIIVRNNEIYKSETLQIATLSVI